MSGEDFLDIPKTDETQQSTPEEYYFSKSILKEVENIESHCEKIKESIEQDN